MKFIVPVKVFVPVYVLLPFVSGNWSCIATNLIGLPASHVSHVPAVAGSAV